MTNLFVVGKGSPRRVSSVSEPDASPQNQGTKPAQINSTPNQSQEGILAPASKWFPSFLTGFKSEAPTPIEEDVHLRDDNGYTPLMLATINGDFKKVQAYLAKGADINAYNDCGSTALHHAIRHPKILQFLIDKGAQVNIKATQTQKTPPLHRAAQHNPKSIMPLLLAGADIHAMNFEGQRPIHVAVKHDNIEACEILFAHGASLEDRSAEGNTLLYEAVWHSQIQYSLKMIRYLVQGKKANLLDKKKGRITPLQHIFNPEYLRQAGEWYSRAQPETLKMDRRAAKNHEIFISFPRFKSIDDCQRLSFE